MFLIASASIGIWEVIWDVWILLATALVLGALAAHLRQSVIVGYLIAGTLIGPNVLGLVSTEVELFHIAEMGVALLLFAIGLELSPQRLVSLSHIVVKTGPLQILITAAAGFGVAVACGLGSREAVVVGLAVAMSSTACVLRLLTDRAEMDSQHGRTALGILIAQDIAVIPMILLVSVLAVGGNWGVVSRKLGVALLLAAVLGGFFFAVFRYVFPRLALLLTLKKIRDLPVLLAAIIATGSAWATHAVGLSPALGAFAAGALLAVSPFATQIRADTRPLTTIMVTLFFSSIGMFGDPGWFLGHWLLVIAIALAILLGKPLIILLVAHICGQPWRYAIASGLCLAQVGEFSFILLSIATSDSGEGGLIGPTIFRAMVSATILTLLCTPYLVVAAPRIGRWGEDMLRGLRREPARPADAEAPPPASDNHSQDAEEAVRPSEANIILIVGFGPAGQRVAADLQGSQAPQQLAVVDLNHGNIEVARRMGLDAHLGDARQRDILEHAGVAQAVAVVLTTPDHATARDLIHLTRDMAPEAFVIVRCRYQMFHWELLSAGAHEVVDEEEQVGQRLAERVRRVAEA